MNYDQDNMLDLSGTEIIANEASRSMETLSHSMLNPKLMALRANLPFIPIMPFPNETLAYNLAAAAVQDIRLPSGTKAIMFSGNGEYYITRKGNAVTPTGVHEDGSGAIMNPEYFLWYVEEINNFSAISPTGCRLSVHCFTQL